MQKITVLRKVALHLFVKKKQKWDKNLVEHHVRGWWLRARDGGCVREMVAACEGWRMRLKGWRMRWKRAERYKLSRRRSAPGFVSKFTAHFHKTMQKACV